MKHFCNLIVKLNDWDSRKYDKIPKIIITHVKKLQNLLFQCPTKLLKKIFILAVFQVQNTFYKNQKWLELIRN